MLEIIGYVLAGIGALYAGFCTTIATIGIIEILIEDNERTR